MIRRLFYFNPTCEMAIVNGRTSYMPPQNLRRFEEDLECISLWLAGTNDFILLRSKLSDNYQEYLEDLHIKHPCFILSREDIGEQLISELHPWGWSPAVHKKLKEFLANMESGWLDHPMSSWKKSHSFLLSRLSGLKIIDEIFNNSFEGYDKILIPQKPVVLKSLEEIQDLNSLISPPSLLKTPWSASGRGLFKIRDEKEETETNQWLIAKLRQQKFLLAEPFLNKILDISFHFIIDKDGYHFLGTTIFKTDNKGRFTGCYTHYPEIMQLDTSLIETAILQARQLLLNALENLKLKDVYYGPVGIDGLFFIHSDGEIYLHPCIEVNLRYTMGLLNINLQKYLHPESKGKWSIVSINNDEWKDLSDLNKVVLTDGFIEKGTVALTPPPKKSGFMAILTIK